MRHHASGRFWQCYRALPEAVRALADKNFRLLREDSNPPSLHFKQVGRFRPVRVGLYFRVLAVALDDGLLWFWIGTHAEYDRLLGN